MLDGAERAENNQGEPINGGFRRSVPSVSRCLTKSGKSENPAGGNSRGKNTCHSCVPSLPIFRGDSRWAGEREKGVNRKGIFLPLPSSRIAQSVVQSNEAVLGFMPSAFPFRKGSHYVQSQTRPREGGTIMAQKQQRGLTLEGGAGWWSWEGTF